MRRLLALMWIALLLTGCGALPENFTPTEASTAATETTAETTTETAAATEAAADGELTVWFLDVGQADSALLCSNGEYMLIDGGNVEDGQFLVSFLQKRGVEELDTVVCTHAHEDHVGGLAAVLAVFPTETVYAPTSTYASEAFDDFMYYVNQQGLEVTIPAAGDSFSLGDATLTVLGPIQSYADTNNTSLVLRAQLGEIRFLFTGDMETDAETDLLDAGTDLRAEVLKIGHHGSSTSTGYRFLYEVMPRYAVISCGAGNSYGHPHEETLSRLNNEGAALYRTDELGTVCAVTDGTSVSFSWEKTSAQPEAGGEAAAEQYIGNARSKIFHASDCGSLPGEKNRVLFDSYEDAIAAGYTPHTGCIN